MLRITIHENLEFLTGGGLATFNPVTRRWSFANSGTPLGLLDRGPKLVQFTDDQIFAYHGSDVYVVAGSISYTLNQPVVEDIDFTSPGDDLSPAVTIPASGQVLPNVDF